MEPLVLMGLMVKAPTSSRSKLALPEMRPPGWLLWLARKAPRAMPVLKAFKALLVQTARRVLKEIPDPPARRISRG
jgi:hypothetical protein